MRRSKGFILTEILTALILQAMFLVTLCGSFYFLLNFEAKSQQVFTARERGQRVIDYVDQRIRNVGVGMWKCDTPGKLAGTLNALRSSNTRPLGGISLLPIEIKSGDKIYEVKEDGKIIKYYGNTLTILYAHRELASKTRLTIATYDDNYKIISIGKGQTKQVILLAGSASNYTNSRPYNSENKNTTKNASNFDNWSVMESSGIPVFLSKWEFKRPNVRVSIQNPTNAPGPVSVSSGSELLYLECERMFAGVDKTGTGAERNFRVQRASGSSSGQEQPHEASILETYFELGTEANKEMPYVLNLYVLASGGKNKNITTPKKPKHWPALANWKDEYKNHTLYVSRASWKLENLASFGFHWN